MVKHTPVRYNSSMITIYFSQARNRALQTLPAPRAGAWVAVTAPTEAELEQLAADYHLERDNLTDAIDLYEAPRVEVEDSTVYIFTRYCYPQGTDIATEPLLIIYTPDNLITIMRQHTDILDRLTSDYLEFVTTQKTKTLLQILGEINRSYEQQVKRVGKDILQIRAKMRQSRLSTREFLSIIEVEEDLNEWLSALQPQGVLFTSLLSGKYLRLYEEDRDIIEDIERSTSELIELLRGRLRTLGNMREAYDAIATNNLNAIFKRLTSISIFITVPTVIVGLWGINDEVPFQHTANGFLYVVGIMIFFTAITVWIFQRKRWL
jgi:magnesium transporter